MNELQSLEDVYNKKIFRIPDYQRGYAWGEKQLVDFWDDLVSLDGNRLHYTGVLSIKAVPEDKWTSWNDEKWLIEKRSYKPYSIVDGQQRLTTSSIFIQCLIEAIRDLPENKGIEEDEIYLGSYHLKEIKEKFIVVSQPPIHAIKTYKFGYEVDNPSFEFLRHKIYNEPDAGSVDETFYTLNLENAKSFFKENIATVLEQSGPNILEEIYVKATQKFMFNVYEIDDDFDVFVAFETMNNRGKKLSDLELLKNRLIYLTSLYPDAEVNQDDRLAIRSNINQAWREIYFQLGRNKLQPLNDDDFLRAHWIMYFKYSRKKGNDYIRFLLDEYFSPKHVLEKIETTVDSLTQIYEINDEDTEDEDHQESAPTEPSVMLTSKLSIKEINDYVLSLKSAAKHWYNSFNPENNPDLSFGESSALDRLNRIGIGYFRPLVVSTFACNSMNEDGRLTLLSGIERFIFIAFRLSRAMSNYRSSVYYGITREVYNNRKSAHDVLHLIEEDLKWTHKEDGHFKSSYFKDYIYRKFQSGGNGFYGWNGLRYFLYEYEEELMKQRNQPKLSWKHFVKSTKDKVSIEHIYPQTANAECWQEDFSHLDISQKKYYNGSLGNLLPLSASINSSLQNDCFIKKKEAKLDTRGNIIRNGYANGSYSEQEVSALDKWGPIEIENRGLKLLAFMERRWEIDLGNKEEKLDLLHLTQNPTDTVVLKQEPSSHVDGNDYSDDYHFKKTEESLVSIYQNIRSRILKLDNTSIRRTKTYISFLVYGKTICYIDFQKKALRFEILRGYESNDGKRSDGFFTLSDFDKSIEVSSWAQNENEKGYSYRLKITDERNLDQLESIIKQKYDSLI